jgi:uncharacterized HAD superfamily protein
VETGMNYLTHDQLIRDTLDLERRLPRDIAGVLGIARSGMLPASIIALHRNLPLGSVDSFAATGGFFKGGERLGRRSPTAGPILVIDDSIFMGAAMNGAKRALFGSKSLASLDYRFAAVYGSEETPTENRVDYVGRIVKAPRYFAWNLFHHGDLANAMLDMDGVLCVDPPITDSVDESAYLAWLPNAEPLHIPSVKVGAICTNRLHTRRAETEAWLAKHGVQYGELLMCPCDTPEQRSGMWAGEFKANSYSNSRFELFVESSPHQAWNINYASRKPVICKENGEAYA